MRAQDTERGRHASLSTLLEEVRERVNARVPRDELDRARVEVCGPLPVTLWVCQSSNFLPWEAHPCSRRSRRSSPTNLYACPNLK